MSSLNCNNCISYTAVLSESIDQALLYTHKKRILSSLRRASNDFNLLLQF